MNYKIHKHLMTSKLMNWLDFAFCLGNHHFYPSKWSEEQIAIAEPHELRHTIQQYYLGFKIHPLVGFPLFLLLYMLVFLPVGLAFFRMLFEYQADRDEASYLIENKYISNFQDLEDWAVSSAKTVSGPFYLFSCPMCITWYFYRRIISDLAPLIKNDSYFVYIF